MRIRLVVTLIVVSSVAGIGAIAPPAGASFPGANGRIAFYDFFESPGQIHTVDPDGTDPLTLTIGPRSKFDPAWSANGGMIAFASRGRFGPLGQLEVMNADGSGRTLVIEFPNHSVSDPAWSPDGSTIAFCRDRGRGSRIFIVGVDGSGLDRLSPSGTFECAPDWSPDGTKIAFLSIPEGLLVMDSDGSNRVPIVEDGSINAPSWSPDGSMLTYTKSTRANRNDVFVVNADGSNRTNLTHTDRRWEFTPAWAPDGMSIAFCRVPGLEALATCELWVMDPDGSNPTRVTTTPDVDEFALSWQPT